VNALTVGARGRRASAALLAAVLAASLAATSVATPSQRDLSAYAGLGTWLDLYAASAWANQEGAVAAMRANGVGTLFLETGNYRQRVDLVRPEALGRFLDAAHADRLRVVAWYLPSLADPRRDLRRSLAAIRFRSASGQRFDSFALDIEASVVGNITLRDARLLSLSARLRTAVGARYPLGAIVPSQVGMDRHPSYWPGFPYRGLARFYDIFLPMAYYTHRGLGASLARSYVAASIAAIRSATGDTRAPVHVIGGLSAATGAGTARGFLRAVAACAPLGFSLYEFPQTQTAVWSLLAARPPAPADDDPVCP
jgi:hypothetical protein